MSTVRYTYSVHSAIRLGGGNATPLMVGKDVISRIRAFEKAPPVRRNRLTDMLGQIDHTIELLELNWPSLPDELRSAIKLGVYQVAERKPTIAERLWSYLFLFRFAMDRRILERYFRTAARLDETLYGLIERDDPRYTEAYRQALESHSITASGAAGRHTKEQWSEWLQRL